MMLNRRRTGMMLVAALCASFASAGTAQVARSSATDDTSMRGVLTSLFTDLGAMQDFAFESTGTVTRGTTSSTTLDDVLNVSVRTDNKTFRTVYLELKQFSNGNLVRRAVGDGNVLWDYDAVHNTYTTNRYGDFMAPGATDKLLGTLRSRTTGPILAVLHLMSHVVNSTTADGAATESGRWVPLVSNSNVNFSSDQMTIDAISPDGSLITGYDYQTPNNLPPELSDVTFSRNRSFYGAPESTTWKATLHRNVLSNDVSYTFAPGTARQVTAIFPQGGK